MSLSTTGNGAFEANLSKNGTEISYRLSYADLEGDVTQAHIHFGGAAQTAGISVWLCANNPPITNAPPGTATVSRSRRRR